MAQGRKSLRAVTIILVAGIAGVAAGALAVYLRGTGDGNLAACTASGAAQARVAAAATGPVAAFIPADPPVPAPELAFRDAAGAPLTLADFSGRILLVNLWATWCVPCREEMPALDRLQAEKGSERFEVVAINIDTRDREAPRQFLDEIGVERLAFYEDETTGVFQALRNAGFAFGLPATLLVDDRGCVLGHMAGPAAWDAAEAFGLVDAALGAAPGAPAQ